MALSNDDKQRIREEEAYRLQVRDELRAARRPSQGFKTAVFWIVLVAVAVLLFAVVRTSGR